MKRILLFVFVICIVTATLMPLTTHALTEGSWTAGGNYDISWYSSGGGTLTSPYEIADAADLAGLAFLNSFDADPLTTRFTGKYIKLINDIDLAGHYWNPIGKSGLPFEGRFDGGGFEISGLNINETEDVETGLFGYASNAVIKNINITDCIIKGTGDTGAIAGSIYQSTITNCLVSGSINGGSDSVGGLVGYVAYESINKTILSESSFTGSVVSSGYEAGGLIGNNYGKILNCFAFADVTGPYYTGGLTGGNYDTAQISNCYAIGTVTSIGNVYGEYSAGGITGKNDATIQNSVALCSSVTGGSVGDIAGEQTAKSILQNNYSIDYMTLVGASGNRGAQISAEESVDPTFYSNTLKWSVYDEINNINGVWYCIPGLYPQLVKPIVIPVTSITISPVAITLLEGETENLSTTVLPLDATNKNVIWRSSNESIVSVNGSGQITALKAGEATVTATSVDGNISDSCLVTVNSSVIFVTAISVSPSAISLKVDDTFLLKVIIEPSNATNQGVTWESSNPSIVTVDSNGSIKAISKGTATITVTSKDRDLTAVCNVTVTDAGKSPIDIIIAAFDDAVENGNISGLKQNDEKVEAFRAKLVEIKEKIEAGEINSAINTLKALYKFVDGEPSPQDLIVGDDAKILAGMIQTLIDLLEL